jgi:hypothetical protein
LRNRELKNNLREEARAVCGASLLFFRDFAKIGCEFLCSLDFLVLLHQGKRMAPGKRQFHQTFHFFRQFTFTTLVDSSIRPENGAHSE